MSPCVGLARMQHFLVTQKKKKIPQGNKYINSLEKDSQIKDYLSKIRNPDLPHTEDITLNVKELDLLHDVVCRLRRLCGIVGYGNFGVLGIDEAVLYAKNYPSIGAFTLGELELLERLYQQDAKEYGFLGEKQVDHLHQNISKNDIVKIPGSGNYLFRGESVKKYNKIKGDLGNDALLTSGIRGLVKQFYLFLNKADKYGGNLSLASRSLAPPGYSYHATGDFDIGQMGFGAENFSKRFTTTKVFKKLTEQGYVEYRYEKDNLLGVRYEPWHIKLNL